MLTLPRFLGTLGACREARRWAEGRRVDEESYLACPRGDWLLWILTELDTPRPLLVLAACACARTALRYVPAGEERPLRAIEVAEAWARGGEGAPTPGQARIAAYAAADADARFAAAAADTAAYVGYASLASASYAAAYACADAVSFATGCAHAAALAQAMAECADIVRGVVPWEVVEPLLAERT